MKRNTAKEKRKRNKGFPYKSSKNLPWDHVNKRDTYIVVVKSTGEVLEKFRTKTAAKNSLPRFKKSSKEEVEVKYNE